MFSRRFGSVTALLVCLTATTLGCGDEINGDQDILAIGDSLLDFHTPDADIATVAAEELGLSVELAASGGTTMLDEDGIPQTYVDGSFSVLIASGGGNDLGGCDCGGGCGDVLDALIAEDGSSGAIVDLVQRAVADGKQVAWVGYMRPQPDAEEFADCTGELDVYRTRFAALDAALDDLVFIDGVAIGSGSEDALYEEDGYHPSEAGSQALGLAVADAARQAFGLQDRLR